MGLPAGFKVESKVPEGFVPEGFVLEGGAARRPAPLLHRPEPGTLEADLGLAAPRRSPMEEAAREALALSYTLRPGVYPDPNEPKIGMPTQPIGEIRRPEEGGMTALTQLHRRAKQAGPLGYPFEAAKELVNLPYRAVHGYEPGEGGVMPGELLEVAATAVTPQLLAGGLPLQAQKLAWGGRLLKESPLLKGIMQDIETALRRGEVGLIEPVEALRRGGLGTAQAKAVAEQLKGRNLLEAVQTYQGALRDLAKGATTEKQVFEKIGVAKLAEDGTFDILKSLGVTDDTAKVFIRHFAVERTEPLEAIRRLAKTPAQRLAKLKISPDAITNPFLPVRGGLREKLTKSTSEFLIPEAVMSLDQNALRVHNNALETYRSIDQSIYAFQQQLGKIFGGMSKENRVLVGKRLDNVLQPSQVSPRINAVTDAARNKILETLAGPGWHDLKMKDKYLSNYFPWIFDRKRGHAPIDLLQAIAERNAGGAEAYAVLDELAKGKALDAAYRMLKKNPKSYFFGNISLHRLSETGPVTHDAFSALNYYVHGAVRKYYMDRFYDSSRRLLPSIEDADLRKYTLDYINAFRGLAEGKGRKTFDTMRTMQAWAKLGLPNLTSPLLNLSQTTINTYTVVGAPTLLRAMRVRFTPEGAKLLKKSGVFLDVAKHEITEPLGRAMQSGSEALLFLFNKSEKFNREIAWLAGYLKAQDSFPKASFAALNKQGRQLVDRTQFVFSAPGRPAFYQSPLGAAAGQFKLFGLNQLRFITGLKGAEIPRFATAIALHGGMKGLPGTQTLVKTLAGMEALQYVKDQELPKVLEEAVIGGVPRAAGVSLEHDIGVGFVPTSLRELVPPAASTMLGALEGVQGIQERDINKINRSVSELIRGLPGGVGTERWRQAYLIRKRSGLQFSPSGDVIKQMSPKETLKYGALGGKSSQEVENREQEEYARKGTQELQNARKWLRHELRIAGAENDVERATRALQEARDAGVLEGLQIGEQFFAPTLLDRFLGAPGQMKQVLWDSKSYRAKMMEEADVLSGYAKRAGAVLKEAGRRLKDIPTQEPKWPMKGVYSPKGTPKGFTLEEK